MSLWNLGFAPKRGFRAIQLGLFLWVWSWITMHAATTDTPSANDAATALKKPLVTEVTTLDEVTVVGQLDQARSEIVPALGATKYTLTREQIESQAQGENAPFNQTLLRLPGVAEDSYGQLHVRGEHANLQYRINDVLLPEGISGFGQELDTRFLKNVSLITGALPAQYGFRTAGIVDIQTKSGALSPGGEVSIYGGSNSTMRESFAYGGATGADNYYFTGSQMESDLGIENPTGTVSAVHDHTDQYKGFAYLSHVIDDTSRVSLILSGSENQFQVPNNPGQVAGTDANGNPFPLPGNPTIDSASLNERQNEQNYYAVLAYQKTVGDLHFQAATFTRYSSVSFQPDVPGDLYFNGVASQVYRSIWSNGVQFDASYQLGDDHTLRGGLMMTVDSAATRSVTTVFATDPGGSAIGAPFGIEDNSNKLGLLYGFYLQDEWKITPDLTVNYGGRFDVVDAYTHEMQFSPRINTVYKVDPATTLHGGYSRYFTPPPLELVQSNSVNKFNGTTNAASVTDDSVVKSERANYFDVGITHQFLPELAMGLDGYYKTAEQQLDEGQFGQALIYSPFNYRTGEIYGTELTAAYQKNGFSAYTNFAWSYATGNEISSGQFQFGQDELDYIRTHHVFLDHDQRLTLSSGVSYLLTKDFRIYGDILYGNGLRSGFANTGKLPDYYPVNLGLEYTFHLAKVGDLKARLDVVNVFDQSYELRDGSGIGVGAPQFGARRGIYGGLTLAF